MKRHLITAAVDSPTNCFNLDSVGAAATIYGAIMTHNVVQGVLIAACKAIVLLTQDMTFLGRIKELGMGQRLKNILESEKSGNEFDCTTNLTQSHPESLHQLHVLTLLQIP